MHGEDSVLSDAGLGNTRIESFRIREDAEMEILTFNLIYYLDLFSCFSIDSC